MAEKRMPAAERQREDTGSGPPLSRAGPVITGRIPADAGPERELTRARWACEG
jgi:hypothetical protein